MTQSPPPESLGQRIARLRTQRGWTQERLAEQLAASRVAVSHFEAGLATPSERTVVLLAGLFKQEPHELIDGTSYPLAKVERLPAVACRYTELDLQLALLQRDLDWAKRLAEPLPYDEAVEWQRRLNALRAQTAYGDEQALIDAALATVVHASQRNGNAVKQTCSVPAGVGTEC